MIERDHLCAFLALAEELHFARAAERLGIAQSSLSSRIKRIEDVLGGRLLERGGRAGVTLTQAGLTFRTEAQYALDQMDRAERVGSLAIRGAAGPASIGYVFSAVLSGVLTRALAAVRAELPEIALGATLMDTPDQIAAVADARLSAGLIRPRTKYPVGVRACDIAGEPMLLALAEDHPLASRREVRAEDLAGETFIVPQPGQDSRLTEAVLDLARVGDIPPPLMISTGDYVTSGCMAAAGHGFVLAPLSMRHLPIPGLTYRSITNFKATVNLALIWRGEETPFVRSIRNALRQAY